MAGINEYSVKESGNLQLRRAGGVFISNTTLVNGNFMAITMLTDVVFTTLISTNLSGTFPVNLIFPAGVTIYGEFTQIKLTSGVVIAYKG